MESNKILDMLFREIRRWRQKNYQRRLVSRGWYDLSVRSGDKAIFIGGCGRSGTTLLREILNRHPRVFCGPETSMFGLPFWPPNIAPFWDMDQQAMEREVDKSENLVRFAENFYRKKAAEFGKSRWADKTPNNVRVIERLLTWFPKGLFIHAVRDGRDAVCSLRRHPGEKLVKGIVVALNTNNPIGKCAERWLHDTSKGISFRGHPRYMEVRYENLVDNPGEQIQRVCNFIQEEYSPNMLDADIPKEDEMKIGRFINNANAMQRVSGRSVGRWRRDLSPDERKQFVNIAGELLISLGYADDNEWIYD